MNHDPMHDVEGLTGALYDGSLGPCRLCEFAAKVRADERDKVKNERISRFGYWHDYDPLEGGH